MKMLPLKFYNIAIPLFMVFFGINSCGSSASVKAEQVEISFTEVLTGSHSNITEQKNIVISNQTELEKIFGKINSTRKPGIPIPEINFEEETAVFLNAGELSTGGSTISVTKVLKEKENVIVVIGGRSPKPGDFVTTVITQPFTLVKFKRQELPVVFRTPGQ